MKVGNAFLKGKINMAAMELFCHSLGVTRPNFSKAEISFFEINLFFKIYDELLEIYRLNIHEYLHLIKFDFEMEEMMVEDTFVRAIIKDILSTDEYNILGIALYTQIPEEVIHEILVGKNTNPSIKFIRRLIELHRSVRKDLYNGIIKRISTQLISQDLT